MTKRLWNALAFIAIVSLACQVGGTSPEGPLPATTAQPTEIPEGMVRLFNEQGEEVLVPEPTPELVEDMLARVDAGEISLEEGVIAALRVMVGETSLTELYPDQEVIFESGWGATALAFEAYNASTDEAARAEIARLMDILTPTQERLDRYALPEEEARDATPGRLAVPPRQTVPCASVWPTGFPEDVEDPPLCLLYRTLTLGGSTVRIYYPVERRDDPAFMAYVDAAAEALQDSHAVYSPLTPLRDVTVIFTLLEDADGTAAQVPGLDATAHGSRPCPISVFPEATTWEINDFKQAIAHELFHCAQFWRTGDLGYGDSHWLLEGSAEFFSNLVYPANNLEQRYIETFNQRSPYRSIMDMTYENAVFFQYLGGRFGPEYILGMMDAITPHLHSHSDQLAALAGYRDFPTAFHDFGEAYLRREITDTSGGPWAIVPYVLPENIYTIGEAREVFMSTAPFTVQRYLLLFESGREYDVARTTSGEPGRDTWRPTEPFAGFVEIPPTLRLTCETDPRRLTLLTSLPPSASVTSQSELTLNFTRAEGEMALVDCCLVGTWEQGTDIIRRNLEAIIPPPMTILNVTGRFLLAITAEGTMTFTPQDYSGTVRTPDGTVGTVRVVGSSVGTYTLPEIGTIVSTGESANFVETLTLPSGTVSIPLDSASLGGPFSGGAFTYTCTDTTLIAYPPPGLAPFDASPFTRLSNIPEPPPEGEQFDPPGSDGGGALPPDIGPGGGLCTQVGAVAFTASGNRALWTFSNLSPGLMEVASITLNWPDANGNLTQIAIGGETVWAGTQPPSLAAIESGWLGAAALRNLPPGTETEIGFTFSEASAAASGYVTVLRFTNGCLVSDPR